MTLAEHTKCKIEFLNSKGVGVGKTAQGTVELPYTLPNELVEFERHKYRGRTSFILKEIVTHSPARIKPVCKYFGACGGCSLQHLNHDDYVNFKTDIVKKSINKENIRTEISQLITIPFGAKRRASFEVIKKNDHIFMGFHRYHSHQIINIDECPAILADLSNLILPLKEVFFKILDNKQKAKIFLNNVSNGVDILFTIKDQTSLTGLQVQELTNFAKQNKILKLSFDSDHTSTVIFKIGVPVIKFEEVNVEVEAKSFLQPSFFSDEVLQKIILESLINLNGENNKNRKLVDLFCGRGTFTIPLSKYFNVDGFEIDSLSIKALKEAILNTQLSIKLTVQDLFQTPLTAVNLNNYDYAIINPPRAGAQAQCSEIIKSRIEKIIYISCNIESFVSDCKILNKGGYKLNKIIPIDQFPYTQHLEIVSIFSK